MDAPAELSAILQAYGHSWEELLTTGSIVIETPSAQHVFRSSDGEWQYDAYLRPTAGFGFDIREIPVRWSY